MQVCWYNIFFVIFKSIIAGFYDCLTFTIAVDIAGLEHVALASALIQCMGGISVIAASAVTGKDVNNILCKYIRLYIMYLVNVINRLDNNCKLDDKLN